MAVFLRKLPFNDILIILKGADAGMATDEFVKWAESIERQSNASPVAPEPAVQLTDIGATVSGNFGGTLPAGIYQINAYRECTTEDPVSSAFDLEIQWTHNGKAMTRQLSSFAMAAPTDTDSLGDTTVIEIDPNTTIGYSLVYASNTPGLAQYAASLIANLLQTIS